MTDVTSLDMASVRRRADSLLSHKSPGANMYISNSGTRGWHSKPNKHSRFESHHTFALIFLPLFSKMGVISHFSSQQAVAHRQRPIRMNSFDLTAKDIRPLISRLGRPLTTLEGGQGEIRGKLGGCISLPVRWSLRDGKFIAALSTR